jgi:hypothetical protein
MRYFRDNHKAADIRHALNQELGNETGSSDDARTVYLETEEEAYLAGVHVAEHLTTEQDYTPYSAFLCRDTAAVHGNANTVSRNRLLDRVRDAPEQRTEEEHRFRDHTRAWEDTYHSFIDEPCHADFFRGFIDHTGAVFTAEHHEPGRMHLIVRADSGLGTVEAFLNADNPENRRKELVYRGTDVAEAMQQLYRNGAATIVNPKDLENVVKHRPEHENGGNGEKLRAFQKTARQLLDGLSGEKHY